MELIPKKKTEVELNGIESFDLSKWKIPYKSDVSKEFQNRYQNIIESYNELVEEINWNNIIYNIKLRYKPVLGKTYYLYQDNDEYTLSMIAPWEWNKESLGSFIMDHNGKWNKIN